MRNYKKILFASLITAIFFYNATCFVGDNTKQSIKQGIEVFSTITFNFVFAEMKKNKKEAEIQEQVRVITIINDIIESQILSVLKKEGIKISVNQVNDLVLLLNIKRIDDKIKLAIQQVINYLLSQIKIDPNSEFLNNDVVEIITCFFDCVNNNLKGFVQNNIVRTGSNNDNRKDSGFLLEFSIKYQF